MNPTLLEAVVDSIIPADDFPSGVAAGGLRFLDRLLAERPDWASPVQAALDTIEAAGVARFGSSFERLSGAQRVEVLDSLAGDASYAWFAKVVNAGFYADPGNGGNDAAVSWSMIGWRPWPGELPVVEQSRPSNVVDPGTVATRYDAIVVGSGAGGGVAAAGLAAAGRNVLVIEAGGWPDADALATDHLRSARAPLDLDPVTGPPASSPRILELGGQRSTQRPGDPAWNGNATTAGGGTRVYGAQAWRFAPDDFRMASRYGVPDGSALADWPFGYDELEPYYARAEWEIGVSGDDHDGRFAGPRSRPYPMKPLPAGIAADRLAAGARRMGLSTLAVPLLVNSTAYQGRRACAQCGMCIAFACRVDAKNGSHNTVLQRAFATGRCSIMLHATVERLLVDSTGRVTGVAVVGERDGVVWRCEVAAAEVVLAAGAIETARLLLNSTSSREPDGIGNNTGQVGRHLQGHRYGGALGIFGDAVEELIGPGASIATADYRFGNDGVVGGGIIANEFVPTPSNTYTYLSGAGLIPLHGAAAKAGMRDLPARMVRLAGPIQEMTSRESRVTVDPAVRDRFGVPVVKLSGGAHPEDLRAVDFLTDRAADWLRAAGAETVVPGPRATGHGPSGGQHQAGTSRMGDDPATSVTDPWGRVWGHDNLRICDASLHVTNGGVNPVLTIYANAFRITDHLTGGS